MAVTKTASVWVNSVSVAANTPYTSSNLALVGYGAMISISILNGGTGPTVGASVQFWQSPDGGTKWYKCLGALAQASLVAGVDNTWSQEISMKINMLRAVISGNTGQAVTARLEVVEVADVNA
jgi:hypothetical protein